LNILILNDNKDLIDVLKQVIEDSFDNVNVKVEDNPSNLLSNTSQFKNFDLFITDYNMPSFTGEDIAKIAKTTNPKIKIILLSVDISDADHSKISKYVDNIFIKHKEFSKVIPFINLMKKII
jgi:two-component system nitrate/nitrite response regulator NarL